MAAIQAAKRDLLDALATVTGLRVYPDMGPAVDPPAAVLSPPALTWENMCPSGPSSARFLVYVVVTNDDRAVDRLLELVPRVAAALDEVTEAVVIRADPGSYPISASDLPAYQIQVDVSL